MNKQDKRYNRQKANRLASKEKARAIKNDIIQLLSRNHGKEYPRGCLKVKSLA